VIAAIFNFLAAARSKLARLPQSLSTNPATLANFFEESDRAFPPNPPTCALLRPVTVHPEPGIRWARGDLYLGRGSWLLGRERGGHLGELRRTS